MTATAPLLEIAHEPWIARAVRRICSFPALLVTLIFARVYWSCRDNIADPDLWWHLRNAQYFVTHGHFPNFDTYSFTTAGSSWMNHEWLPELIYYGAFSQFGLTGIFVVFTATLAVLLMAVFSLSMKESRDPLASGIATIAGGLLAMVGFGPRMQNFGWLCFAGIYAILLRFRAERRAPLWLIPPLFAIWINCHGSWLMGLIIYGIFVGAGLIRRDVGNVAAAPWTARELKQLIVTGAASVILLPLNPFGYRLVLYPFDLAFHQTLNVAAVQEWASIDFNDPRGKQVAVVLGAVFLLALIARKRWRIDTALLTAFVLYCGLTHIRFLLLAGIVLPPLIAPQLSGLSFYRPEKDRRALNALLLAIVGFILVIHFPSNRLLESEVSAAFPVKAAEFLKAHPQQGHIFNLYQWGGYLEWNLPEIQTFVDSRTDIYERNGTLEDYLAIINLQGSEERLDRHAVSYVLYPAEAPLAYFLSRSPSWVRLYGDRQAVIYGRAR